MVPSREGHPVYREFLDHSIDLGRSLECSGRLCSKVTFTRWAQHGAGNDNRRQEMDRYFNVRQDIPLLCHEWMEAVWQLISSVGYLCQSSRFAHIASASFLSVHQDHQGSNGHYDSGSLFDIEDQWFSADDADTNLIVAVTRGALESTTNLQRQAQLWQGANVFCFFWIQSRMSSPSHVPAEV